MEERLPKNITKLELQNSMRDAQQKIKLQKQEDNKIEESKDAKSPTQLNLRRKLNKK